MDEKLHLENLYFVNPGEFEVVPTEAGFKIVVIKPPKIIGVIKNVGVPNE